MIALYFLCLVGVLILLEIFILRYTSRHIGTEHHYDRLIAEPDEEITLFSTVSNKGLLPIMYLRLVEFFPEEFHPTNAVGQKLMNKRSFGGLSADYGTYLMPHRQYRTGLSFTLPKRGVYCAEHYYLEVGDYLGFHTDMESGSLPEKLTIIPRRCPDAAVSSMVGGWLGDISVRRFLPEDPILTVGYGDYTGTEPMRSISWKQTARTGNLQVRRYDHTAEMNVTVLLGMQNGTEEELESCFEITRTVCEQLERQRIPYAFMTNGDLLGPVGTLESLGEGLGRPHLDTILYAMGRSQLRCGESMHGMVMRLTETKSRSHKSCSYILISPPLQPRDRAELNRLQRTTDFPVLTITGTAERYSGHQREVTA